MLALAPFLRCRSSLLVLGFDAAQRALSTTGVCYMVVVDENNPRELMEMSGAHGIQGEIVCSRRAKNERYSLLLEQLRFARFASHTSSVDGLTVSMFR